MENSQYYVHPYAVAISSGANGNANDLAVSVARDAKVKVYAPDVDESLGYVNNTYQEWSLRGVNKRLASNDAYNIFLRLRKTDKAEGYLVFSKNDYIFSAATTVAGGLPQAQTEKNRTDYWWLKIGTVSSVANGRVVTLDTGILGTTEYNAEWNEELAALPLRLEVTNDRTGDTQTPSVAWGEQITLTSHLYKGIATDVTDTVALWSITRNTGDASDVDWNTSAVARTFGGVITLLFNDVRNDLGEKGNEALFTITAYNVQGDVLASAVVNVPHADEQAYRVEMDFAAFNINVDAVGNVIGGLWKEETATGAGGTVNTRTYRLHSAISAFKGATPLVLKDSSDSSDSDSSDSGDDEDLPGIGEYQIYPSNDGQCTLMVENGTIYIIGIENIHDGVSQTTEVIDMDAMKAMKEVTATFIVNCEGRVSVTRSLSVSINHQEAPFIAALVDNDNTALHRNGSGFEGLPIQSNITFAKENTTIPADSIGFDINGTPVTGEQTTEVGGVKITTWTGTGTYAGWVASYNHSTGALAITSVPTTLPDVTIFGVNAVVKYENTISYERRATVTISVVENGVDGDDAVTYELRPNPETVKVARDTSNSYQPATVTLRCGYIKTKGEDDVTVVDDAPSTRIDSKYDVYFRRRLRATQEWEKSSDFAIWRRYRYASNKAMLTDLQVATYDAVEYIICTADADTFFDYTLSNYTTIGRKTTVIVADGAKGARGKVGRFYYYGKVFDSTNTTKQFEVNDSNVPYFRDSANASTFHVFNPETTPASGLMTMAQMWAATSGTPKSFDNDPWEEMNTDFTYLITQAIFSKYAELGQAVFNEDWMFSKYGVLYRQVGSSILTYNIGAGGDDSSDSDSSDSDDDNNYSYDYPFDFLGYKPAYTAFIGVFPWDANVVYPQNGCLFVPNWVTDLLTGQMILGGGKINLNPDGILYNDGLSRNGMRVITQQNWNLFFGSDKTLKQRFDNLGSLIRFDYVGDASYNFNLPYFHKRGDSFGTFGVPDENGEYDNDQSREIIRSYVGTEITVYHNYYDNGNQHKVILYQGLQNNQLFKFAYGSISRDAPVRWGGVELGYGKFARLRCELVMEYDGSGSDVTDYTEAVIWEVVAFAMTSHRVGL